MKKWQGTIILILFVIVFSAIMSSIFTSISSLKSCEEGTGECYKSTITKIVDGDTIKDSDNQSIRFSLTSAPELSEDGGPEAKQYLEWLCPVGSDIVIDEDDGQLAGSYDRTIAKVWCNGINLNADLINNGYATVDERFCNDSEFKNESWTGCD